MLADIVAEQQDKTVPQSCCRVSIPTHVSNTCVCVCVAIYLFQILAVLAMYGKIPARLKVQNLFQLFDLDLDGHLNSSETILMLRFVGYKAHFTFPVIGCRSYVNTISDDYIFTFARYFKCTAKENGGANYPWPAGEVDGDERAHLRYSCCLFQAPSYLEFLLIKIDTLF